MLEKKIWANRMYYVYLFSSPGYNRQHAFEIQVAQLQADIRGLENAQLQLEEFRKKAEAKSK